MEPTPALTECMAAQIAKYNLSDPSAFFENVTATAGLADRIILAPHVFGPNVTVRPARSLPTLVCRACQIACAAGFQRRPRLVAGSAVTSAHALHWVLL